MIHWLNFMNENSYSVNPFVKKNVYKTHWIKKKAAKRYHNDHMSRSHRCVNKYYAVWLNMKAMINHFLKKKNESERSLISFFL